MFSFYNISLFLVSILCISFAGYGCLHNLDYWGWFLVIGALAGSNIKSANEDKENKQ